MTEWRVITTDRRTSFCPVALDLRDEFTGAAVFGTVNLSLDLRSGTDWIESGRKPVRNSGGVFLFTSLGRVLDPVALPTIRVRVRIEAQHYRPAFQATDDGIEFDVPTYNDAVAPAASPLLPEVVLMLPTAGYPFASHIRQIRGRVLDPGGTPLANATVEADGVERVITGSSGGYTLPLRWQAANASVNVAVAHVRSGLSAVPVFTLPADLTGNHDITVS